MDEKPKILFLVDHKHRDLPALSLIAYLLKKLGCISKLTALADEGPIIESFDPGYIVLPKLSYNLMRLVKWKSEGRRLIVIDTEGNHQDKSLRMSIQITPDLYCFWNNSMLEKYREQLENQGCEVKALGFLRGDFLLDELRSIFPSRSSLMTNYGLDPTLKTITIATSTQDSHFSEERLLKKTQKRKKAYPVSADYSDIIRNMRNLRKKTEALIDTILKYSPDINIAVKPHPNETVVYWNELISKYSNGNIALVVGEPINHLLQISDLHVAHNVCTTTIEGLLTGVPTVEIHTDQSEKLYASEHLYTAKYILHEMKDIKKVIDKEFFGSGSDVNSYSIENHSDLDQYVKKYFLEMDGRRCQEYAKYLKKFMFSKPFKPQLKLKWFLKNPTQFIPYYLRLAKIGFGNLFGKNKNQLIEYTVNNPSADNLRATYEIKGRVVDKEFGLFDNRMKLGDEEFWFQKFENLGL